MPDSPMTFPEDVRKQLRDVRERLREQTRRPMVLIAVGDLNVLLHNVDANLAWRDRFDEADRRAKQLENELDHLRSSAAEAQS